MGRIFKITFVIINLAFVVTDFIDTESIYLV